MADGPAEFYFWSSVDKMSGFLASYRNLFAVIGFAWAAKVSAGLGFNLLQSVRIYFLSRLTAPRDLLARYGAQWAVITGASDGIGKAFARQLAHHGMNVILISRTWEKLQNVAQEIETEFRVKTHVIAADFSKQDIYKEISKELRNFEIGILVNNVGVMYDYPQLFLDVPEKKLWELFNVNMTATTMMTYIVLPQMVRRKCGAVINMSSCAAQLPTPQMTVYSATKAFVDHFARALAHEYAGHGIEVQALRPYYVASSMTYNAKPSLTIPSPETYVRHALPTLGVSRRNCGYWIHALQSWFLGFSTEWLWMVGATALNNQIRERVLRDK